MIKKIIGLVKNLLRAVVNFFPWYIKLYKGRAWYTKLALGIVSFFF